MSTYSYKRDKYQNKIARYRSGGAKSLPDTDSKDYLNLLADTIPIYQENISPGHYFPPSNKRQWSNLINNVSEDFNKLYQNYQTLPLFVLIGVTANVRAQIDGTDGPYIGSAGDKHAIVYSLLQVGKKYYLEIFDANGDLHENGDYLFDNDIYILAHHLSKNISKMDWFQNLSGGATIKVRQFLNPKLNFGDGHCDLLSISYIEGRFRFPNDDNVLLDHLTEFSTLTDAQKNKSVKKRNLEIHQKHIPELDEFSLTF